jgi:hypothetical protein
MKHTVQSVFQSNLGALFRLEKLVQSIRTQSQLLELALHFLKALFQLPILNGCFNPFLWKLCVASFSACLLNISSWRNGLTHLVFEVPERNCVQTSWRLIVTGFRD